jgi:hypothetical protein
MSSYPRDWPKLLRSGYPHINWPRYSDITGEFKLENHKEKNVTIPIPCGQTLGHGDMCSEDRLCDQCREIRKLRSELELAELTIKEHATWEDKTADEIMKWKKRYMKAKHLIVQIHDRCLTARFCCEKDADAVREICRNYLTKEEE